MYDNKKIGLALSGGGVRAAAFHLGVLCKLHELNILERIDVISCVSGGSITGAFYLAMYDDFDTFKKLMIANLKESIQNGIIGNWRVIKAIFNPYYSRTDIKAHIYDKLYFKGKTLSDLPKNPKLILNATNLATGKNWKFSQSYMGDWKIGYEGKTDNFKLADAVAASSSVPGIFKPVRIKVKKYFQNPKFSIKNLALSDGGIYDNQGLHSLTSNFGKNILCDYIICSDASFPFEDTPQKISTRMTKVMFRQNNIMMQRIKNMQFQDLIYGSLKETCKSAYFSINWSINNLIRSFWSQTQLSQALGISNFIARVPYDKISSIDDESNQFRKIKSELNSILNIPEIDSSLTNTEIESISSIGTSLKKLSDEEIKLLMKHGSTLCGFQIKSYISNLLD